MTLSKTNGLWKDLLFLHGHIADPRLAVQLADPEPATRTQPRPATGGTHLRKPAMNFFKSLWYLGGLESIDLRIGEEDGIYGRTYGNNIASQRTFGKRDTRQPRRRPDARDRDVAFDDRIAGCH